MRKISIISTAAMAACLLAAPAVRADNVPVAPSSGTAAPAASPATPMPTPAPSLDLRAAIALGVREFQNGDTADAESDLGKVVADPGFAALPGPQRYGLLFLLAATESRLGKYQNGFDHLTAAGQAAPEMRDASYWGAYFFTAWPLKSYDVMGQAMLGLSKASPGEVKFLPYRGIGEWLRETKKMPNSAARRREVLQALHDDGYQPENPVWDAESLWFSLFELDVAAGDTAGAHKLAAEFHDPDSFVNIRDNKAYADFAADMKPADFSAMQDAYIARRRAIMTDHPTRAEAVVYLAATLARANRAAEALPLVDATLAKAAAAPKDKPAFDDDDDQTVWLMYERVDLLEDLGRWDEAEAQQVKARNLALAQKTDLVSQMINLGDLYYEREKPQQALAALSSYDDKQASPFGHMEAAAVRVCAYAQLKDAAHLKTTLDDMRAHAVDNDRALSVALGCAGDTDGLAALFIRRLNDPDERAQALSDAQTWIERPNQTPFNQSQMAQWKAMLARPDVQAAIAKYGSVASYPMVR